MHLLKVVAGFCRRKPSSLLRVSASPALLFDARQQVGGPSLERARCTPAVLLGLERASRSARSMPGSWVEIILLKGVICCSMLCPSAIPYHDHCTVENHSPHVASTIGTHSLSAGRAARGRRRGGGRYQWAQLMVMGHPKRKALTNAWLMRCLSACVTASCCQYGSRDLGSDLRLTYHITHTLPG